MCISFTDIPLHRQEEIWAQTTSWAEGSSTNAAYWARKVGFYADWVTTTYRSMSRADLDNHVQELRDQYGTEPHWQQVITAAEGVLKKAAEVGAL